MEALPLEERHGDLDGADLQAEADLAVQGVDVQVKPVMKKIQTVLDSAKEAMDGATKTLVSVDGFVGDRSNTRHKLNRALEEISAAARSLKSLLNYLERHPNSLLMGKGGAK